ncbi:MAG: peptide-methionine (S)-S-oxide reductase MsrA [Steroidobacteraceae bacterium]
MTPTRSACPSIRSSRTAWLAILAGLAAVSVLGLYAARGATPGVPIPAPAVDDALAAGPTETAVLSGGCFWGMQGVFEHVQGVERVWAGYTGGAASTAHYDEVSTGTTGHAESVQIVFNPREVSYGQLLHVFFSVAHDPTELDYQGPDVGTQYRSEVWYADAAQRRIALAYIAQLGRAHVFPHPIVTRVDPLKGFYRAEAYHQDYLVHHPDQPYIVYNDLPKLANLRAMLPQMYRTRPVLVAANR